MGKYMRKRRGAAGEGVAAVEVSQVVGVRTRSRSAAATGGGVAKVAPPRRNKKALLPAANETASGEPGAVGAGGGDGGSCCYIHLRSRMLFMAAPQQQPSAAEAAGAAQQGGVVALAAGLSRCSSTASSVDVGGQQPASGSHACRSDTAEVDGDHVPDVVTASNSGSVPDRERRETTPSSSRAHGGELSDLESDLVGRQKTDWSSSPAATTSAEELIVPPAQEIQEFFAAAEAAQAKRFASKYNFDFVRGVPLDAGRFEWTPGVSI